MIIHAKQSFTASRMARTDPVRPHEWYSIIRQIAGMHHQAITLNRVSVAGCEQYNGQELATHTNDYFSAISAHCFRPWILCPCQCTCQQPQAWFLPRDPRCGDTETAHIRERKTPWPDNIPNRILKVFAFELSEPVSNINNHQLHAHWGKVWFQVNGGRQQWCRCQKVSQLRQLIRWGYAVSLTVATGRGNGVLCLCTDHARHGCAAQPTPVWQLQGQVHVSLPGPAGTASASGTAGWSIYPAPCHRTIQQGLQPCQYQRGDALKLISMGMRCELLR